jgi:hypothetical protein
MATQQERKNTYSGRYPGDNPENAKIHWMAWQGCKFKSKLEKKPKKQTKNQGGTK